MFELFPLKISVQISSVRSIFLIYRLASLSFQERLSGIDSSRRVELGGSKNIKGFVPCGVCRDFTLPKTR